MEPGGRPDGDSSTSHRPAASPQEGTSTPGDVTYFFDFFTSARTRSRALARAFFGSFSYPFRYVSHPGLPRTNCWRPNLWVRIALLVASCLRTVNAQSAIHGGGFFTHDAHADLYGLSWPEAPFTSLPSACFQIRRSWVR